jgi:hypothetical protein
VFLVTQRARLTDRGDELAHGIGLGGVAEREHDRHEHRDGECAGEVANEHRSPVAQHAAERHAGPLVDERQGCQHEHAGDEIEAQQVEHDEADGEQDRADDRITRLLGDHDREDGREREDRAGHERANETVARGHEDLRFARVHHLGDEFCWSQVGHLFASPLRCCCCVHSWCAQ